MAGLSRPIEIGKIQRFLVEYGWDIGYKPAVPKKDRGAKVGIIGGGPSGLTCAAELARRGYDVVIYEKLSRPGGIVRDVIPEQRLSSEFVDREIADILGLGIEVQCDASIESQEDIDGLFSEGFAALYLATGAWECNGLDAPHRDSEDIIDAISFLRSAKHNASSLAALLRGKNVAVLGGGDTAMDAAVTAQMNGAGSVSVIYRRSFEEMPGSQDEKIGAMRMGVDFLFLTQPVDYVIEGGRLKGLTVVRTRLAMPDSTGRRTPIPLSGTEHVLKADLAVEALGLVPKESIMKLARLSFDDQHRIIVEERTAATMLHRVYAGGDAVRGASIVAYAIADGKRAAQEISRALEQAVSIAGRGR
jgi:NADPH-dependent glutamate synthase beta subunit-like oxidoreductase